MNQIYKEFNIYISENKIFVIYLLLIKEYKYALIGDEYSGKTELFEGYFNLNKSNIGIKTLNINKYKIKLEVYNIDESNIIELLNKYETTWIIFLYSSNSFESFKKIKEYINLIKQKYKWLWKYYLWK